MVEIPSYTPQIISKRSTIVSNIKCETALLRIGNWAGEAHTVPAQFPIRRRAGSCVPTIHQKFIRTMSLQNYTLVVQTLREQHKRFKIPVKNPIQEKKIHVIPH